MGVEEGGAKGKEIMWGEAEAVAGREVGSEELGGQNHCEHELVDVGGGCDGDRYM